MTCLRRCWMIVTVLLATRVAGFSEAPSASAPVPGSVALMDLTPVATEYGMPGSNGVGRIDTLHWGNWNNAQWFWPGAMKVVKTVDPGYEFPDTVSYESAMTNYFAVEGEFMTGVGLWSRVFTQYHWIEYDIPKGMTRFKARLFVSDDPDGWARPMHPGPEHKNQQFSFYIQIDDQEVYKTGTTRLGLVVGGGTKLADIDIPIPPGAGRIRFRLEGSGWGDGNSNNELILNDAFFIP